MTSTSSDPAATARSALPPYFPVDRNEAFIAAGTPDLPATASEQVPRPGLADSSQRGLAALEKSGAPPRRPRLQQAADDILAPDQVAAAAAVLVAEMIDRPDRARRKRELLSILGRNLEGAAAWCQAMTRPSRRRSWRRCAIAETRSQGIAIVAASRDARYDDVLQAIAQDEKAPVEERAAAVAGAGSHSWIRSSTFSII